MQVISKSVLAFDKDNKPAATSQPGEILTFKPMDCFSNQIQEDGTTVDKIDLSKCNPAAGPVFIDGAEPGDVLAVDILNIDVVDHGVAVVFPGTGPIEETCEHRTRIIPIKDKQAHFKDITWPIDPMIGVIGTAPADDPIICGHAFSCGGNMDSKKIRKGSTVYLPVHVDGALLQMGDLHATMGDGEIIGTGIEIAGEILVRVRLIKSFELNWPVVEDKENWYVNACDHDIALAIKYSLLEMQRLISDAYDWDATDTAMYLSLQGNCEINQSCLGPRTINVARAAIPKNSAKPSLIK
ncbi:MAG: acetamidase/formamidase family protein [Bacillota bacterium]|nr:acetamidase/formamidase family protein [Bacillota bacterium]